MSLIVRLLMGLCVFYYALLCFWGGGFFLNVLAHHQSEAAHQEGTVLGECCFLKPYQYHTKSHQYQADGRGLWVAEDSIDHS